MLSHTNRRPLDAEALRDTILFVSGQLEMRGGGSTIQPGTSADYGYQHAETCRSVYVPVFRNALPDVFEAFDFADPSMVTGRRNASTIAPQALFLMNHSFVLEQAQHAAKRILAQPGRDDAARLDRACRMILGRPPSAGERAVARKFLDASSRPSGNETESQSTIPALGSTGYPPAWPKPLRRGEGPPVPSGNLPDGTGAAPTKGPVAAFVPAPASIPVGKLPTGAGKLPAPPISKADSDRVEAWAQICQALFASLDFRFLK